MAWRTIADMCIKCWEPIKVQVGAKSHSCAYCKTELHFEWENGKMMSMSNYAPTGHSSPYGECPTGSREPVSKSNEVRKMSEDTIEKVIEAEVKKMNDNIEKKISIHDVLAAELTQDNRIYTVRLHLNWNGGESFDILVKNGKCVLGPDRMKWTFAKVNKETNEVEQMRIQKVIDYYQSTRTNPDTGVVRGNELDSYEVIGVSQ